MLCVVVLQTFWHSSAHVLGQVLELEFGVDLTIGPALEEGFYYDCYMGDKVGGDPSPAGQPPAWTQGLHAISPSAVLMTRTGVSRTCSSSTLQEQPLSSSSS